MLAAVAGLTWTWLRRGASRTREITLWEWSVLTVVVLIVSPNTIFEYVTIALGAVSYAFARIALSEHRVYARWVAFVASLLLDRGPGASTVAQSLDDGRPPEPVDGPYASHRVGGLSVLRFPACRAAALSVHDVASRAGSGSTHRSQHDVRPPVRAPRARRRLPALVWTLWIQLVPSTTLARQTGVQPPAPETPAPSPVEQALIEYRCRVARKPKCPRNASPRSSWQLRTDFGRDLSNLSAA